MMTADKDFKRLVRERAARTGESYVTARRHLLRRRQEETPLTDPLVPVVFEGVIMRQADQLERGHPARVEIHYQPGGPTFTADLLVERELGDPVHLDCRPSDAVALAVRYEPPPEILVHDSLLDEPAASGD